MICKRNYEIYIIMHCQCIFYFASFVRYHDNFEWSCKQLS